MGNNGGCGFSILATAVVALLVIGGLIWLTGETARWEDAQTGRLYAQAALQDSWGRAQAMIIQAQGQARLDSAEAFTIVAIAALPWLVLGVTTLAALALMGCGVSMVALYVTRKPLIQKHVLVLAGPRQSRRELCQSLNHIQLASPADNQDVVEVTYDRGS